MAISACAWKRQTRDFAFDQIEGSAAHAATVIVFGVAGSSMGLPAASSSNGSWPTHKTTGQGFPCLKCFSMCMRPCLPTDDMNSPTEHSSCTMAR